MAQGGYMPKPRKGERRNKFISRCISDVVGEGTKQNQAIAICHSIWEEHAEAEMASSDYLHVQVKEKKKKKEILKPIIIDDGIKAVYDVTNDRIVEYLFDKDKFTEEEANTWIEENNDLYEVLARTLHEMYPKVLFQ
jgi:hypothetical protein